jgi:hypothetical protein
LASQINASNSGFGGIVSTGDSSGVLELQTTGTTALTIDTSQNVGIGTAIPNSKLHVSSGAATITGASSTTARINMFNNAATTGGLLLGQGYASGTDNIGYMFNVSNAAVVFGTNDTERMRIDSTGNVLVGTASSFSNGKIQSKGVAATKSCAAFAVGQNGDGALEWFNASNTYVGAVTVNASTVVYGGTSDYRLKDNITPMTGALDKVSALKPVTYTWKATGEAGEGFIAHELQEVIPSAVVGEKDAVNKDGSIKPQEIDTSFLVATLTAAIQEQQTIINDLKARITALEGAA